MTPEQQKAVPIIELFNQYWGNERATWSKEVSQDIEFVNNVQWKQEEADAVEADGAPAVAVNQIKPARDRVIYNVTKNRPRWIAVAVENSDVKVAGKINDLMAYIWDGSKGNMHFRKAVEDFEDIGLFVMMAYVDPYGDMGKGEIKICRINGENIFFDPRCSFRNADDSSNVFIADLISESRTKSDYPDFDFKNVIEWSGDIKTFGSGKRSQNQVFNPGHLANEKYYRIIDHYQKIKVDRIRVHDPKSVFEKVLTEDAYQLFAAEPAVIRVKKGQEQIVVEQEQVEKDIETVRKYGQVIHMMSDGTIMPGYEHAGMMISREGRQVFSVPNTATKINVVRMFDLIEQGFLKTEIVKVDRIQRNLIIGEKIYKEMVMPVSRYPFGITMLHHTGNPYCYGDARLAKPIQELLNKTHSVIMKNSINLASLNVFLPNTDPKLIDEVKKDGGKAGLKVFGYDAADGGVPVVVQFNSLNNALYEQLDRYKIHIQELYGSFDFQDGQIQSPPQTRGGTLAIYEAGMNRSMAKLQLIEEALNDLGSVVAEMIPYVYDRRKVVRIVAPNNKPTETIFNDEVYEDGERKIINDLTINKYDIKLISGSTMPSNRWAIFEAYMNMYEKGLIRNPEWIIRQSDLPNQDEILESENALKQAEGMISQMQEAIKKLEGDMQTADRELRHADRQVAISRFKEQLKTIQANANASKLLADYRLNDLIKDKTKEKRENEKEKVS